MTDYVLNVAVGISAGIGALISAGPALQPYTLALCLVVLAVLTFVNMRGIGEAGALFMLPTCVFVVSLAVVVLWGRSRRLSRRAVTLTPRCSAAPGERHRSRRHMAVAARLRQRMHRDDRCRSRQQRRSGVSRTRRAGRASHTHRYHCHPDGPAARHCYLAQAYRIGATVPGSEQYQSVLSQSIGAIAGRGVFYWVSISSILLVLCLSANTSFADFPRLCRAVAEDGFLPRSFTNQGRRLVYSEGIWVLATPPAILLIAFDGITDGSFLYSRSARSWPSPCHRAGWSPIGARTVNAAHSPAWPSNGLGATATAFTVRGRRRRQIHRRSLDGRVAGACSWSP